MLRIMRENLKSLSWILGFVVLTFVFAVFADYGGKGRFIKTGTGNDWAAVVDGEHISVESFLQAARGMDSYYRNLLGDSYDRGKLNLRIGQEAINRLIQEQIILANARSLGLTATPAEITDEIVHDPAMQGENGFIGIERYKSFLLQNGLEPEKFEQQVSRRVVRQKWADLITADVQVRDEEVADEIRRREETADVIYAQFKPEDFKDQIKISDADVAAFYAKNQERYQRGEGRIFDLITWNRLRLEDEVRISEEEARSAYEQSLQSRYTIPEQRRASHILIKVDPDASEADIRAAREAAVAARQRVLGGEDFASVAEELSQDTSAANGGDLGFFGRGAMVIPFEQATWKLEQVGDISPVVRSRFGFHVIKLTGRRDAKVKPFEEVEEQIEKELLFKKAGDLARTRAQAFADAVRPSPETFLDEAGREALIHTRTGALHEGDPLPGMGDNAEVSQALFALEQGEVSAPIAIPKGYIVARYVESHPGGAPPLEEIETTVRADLTREREKQAALRLAQQALASPPAKSLEEIGKELGFKTDQSAHMTRGLALGALGVQPRLEKAIFSGEVGSLLGPIDLPSGPVILQITSRKELTPEEIKEKMPAVRQQLLGNRRQQMLAAVIRELSTAAEVKYNTRLIAQIDTPATPPTPMAATPAPVPSPPPSPSQNNTSTPAPQPNPSP
ncbi:MAG: peptidyl-prolyl cis-trans isomerase [Acidobacteriota bacterium]